MVNDTISDMLTRLRNANLAKHQVVEVPSTKMTRNIASILLEEGFIQSFEEVGESFSAQLLLSLKYTSPGFDPNLIFFTCVATNLTEEFFIFFV